MADDDLVDENEVDMELTQTGLALPRKTAPPPLPSTTHLPAETVAASFSAPPSAPSYPPSDPSAPAGSASAPSAAPPAPSFVPPGSVAPSMAPMPSQAPRAPAGRGPAFYGVVLLVLFAVTLGVGALVAASRKKDAPAANTTPSSNAAPNAAPNGPKVINMPVVDMADEDAAASPAPASSAP